MWTLFYYVFIWPFRTLGGALIDDVLVMLKLKWRPAYGEPIWYTRAVRDWFLRRRQRATRQRHRATLPQAIVRRDTSR